MQSSKNILILKYGLIVVFLCLIISIFIYYQFFLDGPVFLKHYYDIAIHDNSHIYLYLIRNSSDDRRIINIKFPQLPRDFAYIELGYYGNNIDGYLRSKKFAHYNYSELYMEIRPINVDNKANAESVLLEKALIYYSDGDQEEVDIGKIVLHKNLNPSENITTTMSGSSNKNESKTQVISKDDLIIENINSDLDEELKGMLKFTLNGKNVEELTYPINVAADHPLYFESQFEFASEDSRKYNVYHIQKRISFIDSEGNREVSRISNMDYWPWEVFRKEKAIIQYLKERGVR